MANIIGLKSKNIDYQKQKILSYLVWPFLFSSFLSSVCWPSADLSCDDGAGHLFGYRLSDSNEEKAIPAPCSDYLGFNQTVQMAPEGHLDGLKFSATH